MVWSKEVAEALGVLERAYGSFVLVARAPAARGVLVHSHAPTTLLVEDVERWLKAYRGTPPAPAPKYDPNNDLSDPCPACHARHRKNRYEPGKTVKVLVGRGKREEMGGNFDAVPEGSRGKIVSWDAYTGTMTVRVELDTCFWRPSDENPMTQWQMRENYYPCELETLP